MTQAKFNLIGIEIFESCSNKLKKVLDSDTVYFFNNEYVQSLSGEVVKRTDGIKIPDDFFAVGDYRVENLLVNVSCVVGKNGDGKSSLIEILIRLLNNFAYLSGFLSDCETLKFIPGLHARLYYAVGDSICHITCRDKTISLTIDGKEVFVRTVQKNLKSRRDKSALRPYKEFLFYTLINNYSLYAYNTEDFKSETDETEEKSAWIAALFHRNDGYQTPIVLSPKRKHGVIDINNEHDLSLQRLRELFFDCRHGKYSIRADERVEGFAFNLDKEPKLLNEILRDYMQDSRKGARNIIHFRGSYNRDKLNLNIQIDSVFRQNLNFWETFDGELFNTPLWRKASVYATLNEEKTDLQEYFRLMSEQMKAKRVDRHLRQKIEETRLKLGGMTFLQFQRIVLVYEAWKKWIELRPDTVIMCTLSPAGKNAFPYVINYLIYKTIRAFEIYPDYFSNELPEYETPQHFFNNNVRRRALDKMFATLMEDIGTTHSHITLKLRQTLYYLENYKTQSYYNRIATDNTAEIQQIQQLGFSSYVDCEAYYRSIKDKDDVAGALPPPVFKGEFLFSRKGGALYPISRMSSGERQLLNSASAIVYHLKNLSQSRESGLKFIYNNVNIVMEEVELYFHPEYQRRFVNYLLEQLKQIRPSRPLSLNLLFVTHSPFILSDIPKCNVLFMNEGRPDYSMQEDTFGANVHTLLRNGFFLDTVPIGEFAKIKINEMFALLNQSRPLTHFELELLKTEIYLVSEPLLRSQLLKLYSQRIAAQNSSLEEIIKQMEQRIKRLEENQNDKD